MGGCGYLVVCGVCVGAWVVCVLGRVWGLGRVWCVCVEACVLGHGWGVWVACVEACVGCWCCGRKSVSFAPLYYPDTLVNPDTCLGKAIKAH